eukprot:TRINITY_DN4227_c1_g1_i1.p1 TRINITY_DN4227_c1_g1~~TRINITY_DN4227_c1_g1_i1.p1  ORF type:complete len:407 (+),score=60.79 TRINITY_DN4227_c1_g1_i1:61-1281(+)
MACCTSRGDDGEQGPMIDLFSSFWQQPSASSARHDDSKAQAHIQGVSVPDVRSEDVVNRHVATLPGKSHLLAYNVVELSSCSRRPLAKHIPCNSHEAIPLENEHFSGKVCLIYRPVQGLDLAHPYYDHFSTRKRNWEFRLQGKFKTVPIGELYVGAVLRDFDYDQSVATSSRIAMNTAMSLIKYQYKIHFAWGARCKEAFKPDAELGCAVSDFTVFDQIIVTPFGRPVPALNEDLDEVSDAHGMSLMRRDIGLSEYGRICRDVVKSINTEDTYTFRLWGLSQLLDVLGWQLKIGARVSLEHFMKDFPVHLCMYDVDADDGREVRHLESRKRYFFDLMGWSNVVSMSPLLAERYCFQDSLDDFEKEDDCVHTTPSANSFHSCDGGATAIGSKSLPSGWRTWIHKLKG